MTAMNLPPYLSPYQLGESLSVSAYPNRGVPQGTFSGPKDVLVHINDLRILCEMVKYVEDSTVFEICTHNSVSVIQKSALIVTKWSKEHDMRINTSNTKEMVIGFGKRTIESISNITIDNCVIERVEHAKVLGVKALIHRVLRRLILGSYDWPAATRTTRACLAAVDLTSGPIFEDRADLF